MKKGIPVIIACILILAIGAFVVLGYLQDKYSYGKEWVDYTEYFQLQENQLAIVLQNQLVEQKAAALQDTAGNRKVFLDFDTMEAFFGNGFYIEESTNELLYTDALETHRVKIEDAPTGDAAVFWDENTSSYYIDIDYCKSFYNFLYSAYEYHVQIYTSLEERKLSKITKDTMLRQRGGIKSLIVEELTAGAAVEVLEQMENWSKVKTEHSYIGYVENKYLEEYMVEEAKELQTVQLPEYTSKELGEKVCLGWHSIGGKAGNSTLDEMVRGAKPMNVIAPTWFSLCDNEGGYRSFGEKAYVDRAHAYGLQVWGVLDNFNYELETKTPISTQQILSVEASRNRLITGLLEEAKSLGLDGINLDFEHLDAGTGPDFVQFIKELSAACRKNALFFSIDNYVPFTFNEFYRLDIQGEIADYVVIMGYDEHWHGCGEPGSVASISYVTNGIEKTLKSVPAHKTVNALPFYTFVWTIDGAKVTDQSLTIRNTPDMLAKISVKPVWDEETCQNYLEWESGGKKHCVWLEDGKSIGVKLNVMNAHKLGGVAVWRLGYGTEGVWDLISAYLTMP